MQSCVKDVVDQREGFMGRGTYGTKNWFLPLIINAPFDSIQAAYENGWTDRILTYGTLIDVLW